MEQLGEQGYLVSHTDPREACTLAANTEPGASNDASREAKSWVDVILMWVGVTARCASDPGKSCLLQLMGEPVSQRNKPIKLCKPGHLAYALANMLLPLCR